MVVSVRRDGVSASINGKTVAQLATDFKNLDLQGHIGVGLGVLGIHTANHSIVHSAEVVEIGGPGKIIRHLDAQQTRAQAMAFRNLRVGKTLSLTEMRPRAQQIGWGTFMINQNGFSQPVMINGRECGRYLYAHAPSSLIYDIPEGAIGFRAVGARPAGTFRADIGQWRLAVCVDDCEVLLSRGIQEEGGHIDIEIPIPKGSRLLELRADPLGKSEHDGAIWANPEFLFPADAGTGR